MRAIFINAPKKEVTEIELPDEPEQMKKQIRTLLRSKDIDTMPSVDRIMQLYLDRDCLIKESQAFTCSLFPVVVFGSQILLGRDPVDGRAKPLYHWMTVEKLSAQFLSKAQSSAERVKQHNEALQVHRERNN